jgi:hypothetical protein
MNAFEHLGDTADLYAIGALDDAETEAVDRHVASCNQCAHELAAAEDRVATLAVADARHTPPPQLARRIAAITAVRQPSRLRAFIPAMAAALAIGLLPSVYFWQQNQTMHAAMLTNAEAMNRVVSTPHRSVDFSKMSDGSAARVMYAQDGSWYVVLVSNASKALSVAWMHDGRRTMLGTATPHGPVAMLYLPKSHRMDQLALLDGEQVVAEAQLGY